MKLTVIGIAVIIAVLAVLFFTLFNREPVVVSGAFSGTVVGVEGVKTRRLESDKTKSSNISQLMDCWKLSVETDKGEKIIVLVQQEDDSEEDTATDEEESDTEPTPNPDCTFCNIENRLCENCQAAAKKEKNMPKKGNRISRKTGRPYCLIYENREAEKQGAIPKKLTFVSMQTVK